MKSSVVVVQLAELQGHPWLRRWQQYPRLLQLAQSLQTLQIQAPTVIQHHQLLYPLLQLQAQARQSLHGLAKHQLHFHDPQHSQLPSL